MFQFLHLTPDKKKIPNRLGSLVFKNAYGAPNRPGSTVTIAAKYQATTENHLQALAI